MKLNHNLSRLKRKRRRQRSNLWRRKEEDEARVRQKAKKETVKVGLLLLWPCVTKKQPSPAFEVNGSVHRKGVFLKTVVKTVVMKGRAPVDPECNAKLGKVFFCVLLTSATFFNEAHSTLKCPWTRPVDYSQQNCVPLVYIGLWTIYRLNERLYLVKKLEPWRCTEIGCVAFW